MLLAVFVWIYISLVSVSCSDNLALYKPAWLSSSYSAWGPPGAAVDGQIWPDTSVCIHTEDHDPSPWIVVDLLGQYHITHVFIYNRQDCCQYRLHDFVIEVFDTNPVRCLSAQARLCKQYPGAFGTSGSLACSEHVVGRYVRLWKPTKTQLSDGLNLCELEVYGTKKDIGSSFVPVISGQRLESTNLTSQSALSSITCVIGCQQFTTCLGVNYNSQKGVCELLIHPGPTDTVSVREDWVYCGHDFC